MRLSLKNLTPCLLAALLAVPVFTTGCKTQNTTVNNQPDDYGQWEHETNRPHQDLDKRTPADRQEYQDWQRSHGEHPSDQPNEHPNDHH